MYKKIVPAILAIVLVSLFAAACGEDDHTTTTVVEVDDSSYYWCERSKSVLDFTLEVGDTAILTKVCTANVAAVSTAYQAFSDEVLGAISEDGIEDGVLASAVNTHLTSMKGADGKQAFTDLIVKVRRPKTASTAD